MKKIHIKVITDLVLSGLQIVAYYRYRITGFDGFEDSYWYKPTQKMPDSDWLRSVLMHYKTTVMEAHNADKEIPEKLKLLIAEELQPFVSEVTEGKMDAEPVFTFVKGKLEEAEKSGK
jgi:hypothetical protein